eukprot:356922-Chlamydomonas_euryale.AAC.6
MATSQSLSRSRRSPAASDSWADLGHSRAIRWWQAEKRRSRPPVHVQIRRSRAGGTACRRSCIKLIASRA